MSVADPFIDDLVERLVECPGSPTLMRRLAEVLVTDGRPDAAGALAAAALQRSPGDLGLLRVAVETGVDVPDSPADLAALWDGIAAPPEF